MTTTTGTKAITREAESAPAIKAAHNLILENRQMLTLSGVSDIDSFDEHSVIAFTSMGELTIRGKDLHINKLSVDTGELIVNGEISALIYGEQDRRAPANVLARLFR